MGGGEGGRGNEGEMRERGLEQNIRELGRGGSFIYSLMNNKMRLTFKRINFLGE